MEDLLEVARQLVDHIRAMKDDTYMQGHPEWEHIVKDAELLNELLKEHE